MTSKDTIPRRTALQAFALGSAGLLAGQAATQQPAKAALKRRIRQSTNRAPFKGKSTEETAKLCNEIGLVGLDFVGERDWPILKKHGLIATLVSGAGSIRNGSNEKKNHAGMLERFKKTIKAAASYKWPNVITFSGNRKGMSDEEGLENSVIVMKEAAKIAEDAGVTICMELLNSKVNHRGYMCDHTTWGAELCKRVGSPRFKLLYDIYHMQIMEGDIIRTIRDNIQYIGHFHTAGNPGRRDLDDEQELYYPAIMRAIAKLTEEGKYKGFVAHEFHPKNGVDSLRHAVKVCDV